MAATPKPVRKVMKEVAKAKRENMAKVTHSPTHAKMIQGSKETMRRTTKRSAEERIEKKKKMSEDHAHMKKHGG